MYLRLLVSFSLLVNVAAQAVTLYADTTDLSAGYSPHLTCNHNYNHLVSWWRNGEIVLRSQVNGEECHNEPTHPDYLADCTCANSVHTCTLKDLSWSNFGDRWACYIGSVQSNILTLTLPAPKSVTLYADTTDVSAVHAPLLTCHHDNYPIVSWWRNGEIALSAKVNGGDCLNTPTNPDYLTDCTCSYTVHICTLRNLGRSNVGDQWACCISESDGTVIKSNILTLELPAPKSVNLSADTTDVSAGHSPLLTCHHDSYPIVSWWLNGVIAMSAQVNGTDCLNTPKNPAYLTDCTCTYTVHICTLKNFDRSNVGDQWACSISDWDGTVIKSNILTLTLPAFPLVTLYADTTDVSAGHSIHMTCHHYYDPLVSWWLNGEIALSTQVNGGDCLNNPTNPDYLANCTCANSVHTCTLKYLSWPNVGDQWACSISDWNGTVIKSNILILTLPAVHLVTLHADTTDVSAGRSPHLTCHHDNYQIVSWWLNGEIAQIAQVNEGDCLNTPTNPNYLADCTCTNTVHTCTLKHLSKSNVGDQWGCSIRASDGTVIKSNILTLELPAPKWVNLSADTTDVSAGHSPHLTCHHENYQIVSWWLNGVIALSAQVNGTECLNTPKNPAYLTDCMCAQTVHTCTLKNFNTSNVGDQWACSISDWDGTVIKSNILTLTLPASQLVTLYAETTVVSAGHSIHMACHHYNDPLVSWWINGEIALSAQVNRGDCMNTPTNQDYLANCTCANTVHTCTLKHLSWPNVGDKWACSISGWNGTVIKSNILTLALPAAHLVTLHADTTDVSAGHSPHLTCHHDYYQIVSWWLNGEIALNAQVNGEDCLNIPTNPYYLTDCTCTNTVHACTLRNFNRSNVGDQWACSIRASDGTVLKSNIMTFELPELPRGNSAQITVIAGSVGGALGGLIIILVMVIIFKRKKNDNQNGSDDMERGSDSCDSLRMTQISIHNPYRQLNDRRTTAY